MWKWLNQIKNSLNVGVNTWYHTYATRGVSQNKMTYWGEYDIIGAYGKIKQDKEYTPSCGKGPPACAEALMNPLISMTLEVDDPLIIYECDGGHDREGGPQGRCLSVWSPVICRTPSPAEPQKSRGKLMYRATARKAWRKELTRRSNAWLGLGLNYNERHGWGLWPNLLSPSR